MNTFRTAIYTATLGIALVATPALAEQSVAKSREACIQMISPHGAEIRQKIAGNQGGGRSWQAAATEYSASPATKAELARIGCADQLNVNDFMKVAGVSDPAPSLAASPASGDAAISDQIADHERRITALEAAGKPAEAAAERAKVTKLKVKAARRNRDAAASNLKRIVARKGATSSQISAAAAKLQAAEAAVKAVAEEAKKSADAAKASAEASEKSADKSATAAANAATAKVEAGKSATAAEAAAKEAKEAAGSNKRPIWVILALSVIGLLWNALLQWTKASKKEVEAGFDRVERQFEAFDSDLRIDPNSLELIKSMNEGDSGVCQLLTNGVPTHAIPIQKLKSDQIRFTADVGRVSKGTPIALRNLQSTFRKEYRDNRHSFQEFEVKASA